MLAAGGCALDAVCATVEQLEDDPLFNAGRGAALTAAGTAELDACVMTGDGRAGAIAACRHARNPVHAARKVMEETPAVLLVAPTEDAAARTGSSPRCRPEYFLTPGPPAAAAQRAGPHCSRPPGTARSARWRSTCTGRLAAATSTGGMVNQSEGRVGDTPIVGAGTYARDGVVRHLLHRRGRGLHQGRRRRTTSPPGCATSACRIGRGHRGHRRRGARPARGAIGRADRGRRGRLDRRRAQLAGDVRRLPRRQPPRDPHLSGEPSEHRMTQIRDECSPGWTSSARRRRRWPARCWPTTRRRAGQRGHPGQGRRARARRRCCGWSSRLGIGSYPEFQAQLRAGGHRAAEQPGQPGRRPAAAGDGDATLFQQSVAQRVGLVEQLATTRAAERVRRRGDAAGRPRAGRSCVSGGYFSRHVGQILAMQLDQLVPGVVFATEPLGRDIGSYLSLGKDCVVDRLRPAPLRAAGQAGRRAGPAAGRRRSWSSPTRGCPRPRTTPTSCCRSPSTARPSTPSPPSWCSSRAWSRRSSSGSATPGWTG